jgi:hypothetical protein
MQCGAKHVVDRMFAIIVGRNGQVRVGTQMSHLSVFTGK